MRQHPATRRRDLREALGLGVNLVLRDAKKMYVVHLIFYGFVACLFIFVFGDTCHKRAKPAYKLVGMIDIIMILLLNKLYGKSNEMKNETEVEDSLGPRFCPAALRPTTPQTRQHLGGMGNRSSREPGEAAPAPRARLATGLMSLPMAAETVVDDDALPDALPETAKQVVSSLGGDEGKLCVGPGR